MSAPAVFERQLAALNAAFATFEWQKALEEHRRAVAHDLARELKNWTPKENQDG